MNSSLRTLQPVALGSLVVLGAILLKLFKTKRGTKLPPGPPGIFFFGNLFQLSSRVWLKFTSWKTYRSVVYLDIAGQPIIVLNNAKAAADLLDRRALIYSDRPGNIVASEMMTGGLFFAMSHYGDTWRRMRRVAQEALSKNFTDKFHAIQSKEAVLLTHSLLVNPTAWASHLRRTTASVILSMVYDTPALLSEEDPNITRINDFAERLVSAAYPGAYLVEYFTWMRYLPSWMAKWKRDVLQQYRIDDAMFQGLFNEVSNRVAKGDQLSGFCAHLLEKEDRHGLNEKESAWTAAALYAAGADTTSSVLGWFLFAMLSFPEVQRRAQTELDAVVGRSRMPTFADYNSLPYIRALIKEILRWAPVGPIGLPHRLMEDDCYDGHFIPKGSIVIANVWAMNRDPEVYGHNADLFEPTRHLDEDGRLTVVIPETKDEGHNTFGFGRRNCVGRHVANDSLFIDCANILWALSIEPFYDHNGVPIIPSLDESINTGIVVRPPLFRCSFKPRFSNATGIVSNSKELIA
ncbi:cytochrome P450 [Mycena albidolilacea]|uniref:Cytochrome P450 n=1 Tax=Mycena albidolilacea TaxID=1033008 RepID=A0AAD6YZE5_9AGAR|nr:cytochrome P450 [Mycena albidolilacea]